MAGGTEVKCRCNEDGLPLWGFCDDDLVCPRCGEEVARLRSANQQPDGDPQAEVWIYPQKRTGHGTKQYAFPLVLCYADQNRRRQERSPAVDLDHSVLRNAPPFEPALASWGQGRSFHCHLLRRDRDLPPGTAPDEITLPEEGLESQVALVGDFGRRTFHLRICNSPQIEVALVGRGVEEVKRTEASPGGCWQVILSELLDVELIFRAVTAPVLVAEELREIAVVQRDETAPGAVEAGVLVEMLDPLPAGTRITPGSPWSSRIKLDTRQFRRAGQKCQLLIRLKTAISRTPPLVLDLERVGKRPDFWPSPLTVDVMYAGEVRSSAPHENMEGPDGPVVIRRLYVSNIGDEAIRLKRPKVTPAAAYPIGRWIDVAWAPAEGSPRPGDSEGEIEIAGGQRREIYVRVDLRGLKRDEPVPCPSLAATISVVDDRDVPWSVEFRITEVRPRTPLRRPVAIDFGNSHSYVATWNPGEPYASDEPIVPVHDIQAPERFPTAIFFHDLSDPNRPVYAVGRQAMVLGSAWPEALAADLKRWVGDPGHRRLRDVCDAGARTRSMEIDVLVQSYLKALVQRAEAILRKYTITRFGLSYPARFGADRRDAFQRLVRDFCERSVQDPDLAPLEPAEFDIDEACAVAIGFVFESEVQEKLLPAVVSPQNPTFVVASFDLGGGSLDTALLRFTVEDGDLRLPVFSSEYLGIGGNEYFGGDNITVSTMELLRARIRAKLADPVARDWFDRIPTPPKVDSAPRDLHRAYGALWSAAEEIKVFQSRHAPPSDNSAGSPKEASSAASEEDRKVFRARLQAMLVSDQLADAPAVPAAREALRRALEEGIERDEFLIDLGEMHEHVVECDMWGKGGYSVRQRLEKYVDELRCFAARKDVGIHFVVLGGSGSRLPLVQEVLTRKLPDTRIVCDPDRIKCRVAVGLARYLDVSPESGHRFARSRDYTTDAIGVRIEGAGRFLAVIPDCSPVNDSLTWRKIEEAGRPLRIDHLPWLCVLYREEDSSRDRPLGWFLAEVPPESSPAPPDAATPAAKLPLPRDAVAELRLAGSETQIELRIVVGDQIYGPWPMHRGAPPTDS